MKPIKFNDLPYYLQQEAKYSLCNMKNDLNKLWNVSRQYKAEDVEIANECQDLVYYVLRNKIVSMEKKGE